MSITSSTIGKRTFKIVLLGDSSTGKTSIIERFVNNRFEEGDNPTIGIDFQGKNITHNNITCRVQLWDTAGQERYRSLIPGYLRDAICSIFVFDIERPETLANLQSWIDLYRSNRSENTVMVVCGNKSDLNKKFEQRDLNAVLDRYKMKYYEVSALTGSNLEAMFVSIIDEINAMQKSRHNRASEDDDAPAPATYDNLRSQRGGFENESTTIRVDQPSALSPNRGRCCY